MVAEEVKNVFGVPHRRGRFKPRSVGCMQCQAGGLHFLLLCNLRLHNYPEQLITFHGDGSRAKSCYEFQRTQWPF